MNAEGYQALGARSRPLCRQPAVRLGFRAFQYLPGRRCGPRYRGCGCLSNLDSPFPCVFLSQQSPGCLFLSRESLSLKGLAASPTLLRAARCTALPSCGDAVNVTSFLLEGLPLK